MSDYHLLDREDKYPFTFKFSTADNVTTLKTFTLESDNADVTGDGTVTNTPFAGKMLLITSFNLVADAGVTLGHFAFDGKTIVAGSFEAMAGADPFKADAQQVTLGSAGNAMVVKDIWGQGYLPCRWKIDLKASATAPGSGIDATIKGFVLPNRF